MEELQTKWLTSWNTDGRRRPERSGRQTTALRKGGPSEHRRHRKPRTHQVRGRAASLRTNHPVPVGLVAVHSPRVGSFSRLVNRPSSAPPWSRAHPRLQRRVRWVRPPLHAVRLWHAQCAGARQSVITGHRARVPVTLPPASAAVPGEKNRALSRSAASAVNPPVPPLRGVPGNGLTSARRSPVPDHHGPRTAFRRTGGICSSTTRTNARNPELLQARADAHRSVRPGPADCQRRVFSIEPPGATLLAVT